MIPLETRKILTSLQKLPKYVEMRPKKVLPQALRSCPKCNKSPNLVTLSTMLPQESLRQKFMISLVGALIVSFRLNASVIWSQQQHQIYASLCHLDAIKRSCIIYYKLSGVIIFYFMLCSISFLAGYCCCLWPSFLLQINSNLHNIRGLVHFLFYLVFY